MPASFAFFIRFDEILGNLDRVLDLPIALGVAGRACDVFELVGS